MPNDTLPSYRTPYEDPEVASSGPREDLGKAEVPVVGEVAGEIRLDQPFHVALDRSEATLRPAGGLVLRSAKLPTVVVRGVHVDLVDGLVRADAAALGPFFDRVATVVLCSVLRQTIGWKPGTSLTKSMRERLPRRRRRLPGTGLALTEETGISVNVAGDAVTLTFTRPALLRFLGLPMKVSSLRYEFATGKVTSSAEGVGPVRRGILRLMAWGATKWLRPRLPAALREPGYDLFADPRRRAHLQALVAALRGGKEEDEPEEMGAGAGRPGHELARAGTGDKAGMLGVLSVSKAAVVAALVAIKISADDVPAQTRVLMRLPIGLVSRVALCTDRGGEVILTKYAGGVRIEAPLGIYLFADQFPELSELRLTRVTFDTSRKDEVGFGLETEPPLGPMAKALLDLMVEREVRPRVPSERLAAGGVWDDGADHVLWKQDLGDKRSLMVRTRKGAEVRVRHRDEDLVIEAPGGIEALFDGLPVPAASFKKITYRWEDGAITVDGATELGAFGQDVASSLMRVRGASHLPQGVAAKGEVAAIDKAQLEKFPHVIAGLPLPLIGKFELRMDPLDILNVELGPALLSVRSERGLLLVAQELGLVMHVHAMRHDLPAKKLVVEATPEPGPYMTALATTCLEALLLPLLRKGLPLAPDASLVTRWELLEVMGVRVTLPPGATLTARRTPDMLEVGGSAPIEVDGQGGPVADFTINKIRWIAADDRVVVDSTPIAGQLAAGMVRRAIDRLVPDFVARAVAERLALPAPKEQTKAVVPTMPALFETEVANLGPIGLYVDSNAGLTLTLHRERADLRFGAGAVIRVDRFDAQLVVHRIEATLLPFALKIDSEPATGELEDHLLAQVVRTVAAPLLRMLWPTDVAPLAGRDVLLAWGPIVLCVPPGGQLEVRLDHESTSLRSEAGVFVGGIDWLPNVGLHALTIRHDDGAVDLEVGEVAERFYHEPSPVSATTTAIAARMIQTLVSPHVPAWAQRLGVRILPPPKPLADEPDRKVVWDVELPGGLAKFKVAMDPMDILEVRASGVEVTFTSEMGLHLDLERLGLRLPVFHARYHMLSGELQLGDMGQFENAVAEGLLRKALATVDPTAAPVDEVSLIDVLERFPRDDHGNRILFGDKVVQVLLQPESVIVVRVEPAGLVVTVDPPLKIDGPAVLNFVFAGLRYDFAEGEFHLDWKHDGVISRAFAGLSRKEGEGVLNSMRPVLPAAMRRPGYSLANDPDPRATFGQLVRTVSRGPRGELQVLPPTTTTES